MRIASIPATPNFEARIKLKAPNIQKIKETTVNSVKNPGTYKSLASMGLMTSGVGSIALAASEPSIQQVENADGILLSLGTTVTEIPLLASVAVDSNDLSDAKSSVSVKDFLFNKLARKMQIAVNKKNLESFKDEDIQRNSVLAPMVSTAAGIEYSGVVPAESVESLVSGADVAKAQATSQISGMISLAFPAISAFISAFKELESAEASNSFFNNTSKKSANDKKLPS
jgi:hypothetical protein